MIEETNISVFISYSHKDEWLKNEFESHLNALVRNQIITKWSDRQIEAGQIINDEIDNQLTNSHIICFLVSSDFIGSNYCMEREYKHAQRMHKAGKAIIVPIIIRSCDWDVYDLKSYAALPLDAQPITDSCADQASPAMRDKAWTQVIGELKRVITKQKKILTAPILSESYIIESTKSEIVLHPSDNTPVDDSKLFVDPQIFLPNENRSIDHFKSFIKDLSTKEVSIIVGEDRSGKTVTAKFIQQKSPNPHVLLQGKDFTNSDIDRTISREIRRQLIIESDSISDHHKKSTTIIIDDFEGCRLHDAIKEKIVRKVLSEYKSIILISNSSAPSYFFTPYDLPDPTIYEIDPLTNDKILRLIRNWQTTIKASGDADGDDRVLLNLMQVVGTLFSQTEMLKFPYSVISLVQMADYSTGRDITHSSFAACYDSMIKGKLISEGVDFKKLDEIKNFLSRVAYIAYSESDSSTISKTSLLLCLQEFEENHLSDPDDLKEIALKFFLFSEGENFRFSQEYLWYYFCSKYFSEVVFEDDRAEYISFVDRCAAHIFSKKFASLSVFLSYFSKDEAMIKALLSVVDRLFIHTDDWRISDDKRAIILGLKGSNSLISNNNTVGVARKDLLRDAVESISEDEEKMVAQYTLPFCVKDINDINYTPSSKVDNAIDVDSYMSNVNAMYRVHSVIGQILTNRAGTYSAKTVVDSIDKMIQSGGRFANANLAIAGILLDDEEGSIPEIQRAFPKDTISPKERYKKIYNIFSFWSVYIAQAGIGRHLAQDHCIRALDRLVKIHETDGDVVSYNFSSVRFFANAWKSQKINRNEIDELKRKYGEDSSLFDLIRKGVYFFTYYMPVGFDEKQSLASQLNMRIGSLRKRERSGVVSGERQIVKKGKRKKRKGRK